MKDITRELGAWLDERKGRISLSIAGPKGGSVPPETWIPDGWYIQITIVAPEDKVEDASPYSALAE
jgi:hypothetical protein